MAPVNHMLPQTIDIMVALSDQGVSHQAIASHLNVSSNTVWRRTANIRRFGEPYAPSLVMDGRPRALTEEQEEQVLFFVRCNPTAFLDEVAWWIYDTYEVAVSESTVCRLLRRHNFTRKRAERAAQEQNMELRTHFKERQASWPADEVCCVDESGANERTGDRKYGWSLRGLPCQYKASQVRSKRWSILPAITTKGYLPGALIHQGAITSEIFLDWLEHSVLPQLAPGMILVMDNASIHRGPDVEALCQRFDVRLEYLPPYSPDFNPIEISFSVLKRWIKRHWQQCEDPEDMESFLRRAVDSLEPSYARGWFKKSGYRVDL